MDMLAKKVFDVGTTVAQLLQKKKGSLENPGIDPGTSRMLSERSTMWANYPPENVNSDEVKIFEDNGFCPISCTLPTWTGSSFGCTSLLIKNEEEETEEMIYGSKN